MQSIKSTVGLCVVFISIVLVMFFFSKLRVPELSADEMRTQGVFILPTPRDIGPFELLDHTGAVFNRQSLEGHWSFIFFGFTNCPDVCPTSLSVLGQVENQLKPHWQHCDYKSSWPLSWFHQVASQGRDD